MLFLAHIIITAHLAELRPKRGRKQADRDAFVEDVEFLLDNGVSEDGVARRLGYRDREHLRRRLARIGRRDILDGLSRARRDDAELWRAAS